MGVGYQEPAETTGARQPLILSPGLNGSFGVVKLWPNEKVAEDEVIARLQVAAERLGLRCVPILADGTLLAEPGRRIRRGDLDFVIHLHFETPKAYDAYSFVALWNPWDIVHDYAGGDDGRFGRNLLSHDDFLSCDAFGPDDHILRLLHGAGRTVELPFLELFPSTPAVLLQPRLSSTPRLFYAGVNWDRLVNGKSRHESLLARLDRTDWCDIYGPRKVGGINVWRGFRNYRGSLPFDGQSLVSAIAECGVSLVLSSRSHRSAGAMSSRLFESAAAGAVIICDRHPFAERHFGDSLLYIDSDAPAELVFEQVTSHMAWIRSHPDEALAMAQRAQAIYRDRFTLDRQISEIYRQFPGRRERSLAAAGGPSQPVHMQLLMPAYDSDGLEHLLNSSATRDGVPVRRAVLTTAENVDLVVAHLRNSGPAASDVQVREVAPFALPCEIPAAGSRRFGQLVFDELRLLPVGSRVMFVSPGEGVFGDAVSVLQEPLAEGPATVVMGSWVTVSHQQNPPLIRLDSYAEFGELHKSYSTATASILISVPDDWDNYGIVLNYLHVTALLFIALVIGRTDVARAVALVQDHLDEMISRDLGALYHREMALISEFLGRTGARTLEAEYRMLWLGSRQWHPSGRLGLAMRVKPIVMAIPMPAAIREVAIRAGRRFAGV